MNAIGDAPLPDDRPKFLDDLLATVSHQLRTPLTIVLGMARLLEKKVAAQGDREMNVAVHEINFAAEWMERSIDQMLLLAQLEMQRATPEPILLRTMVQDALEHHERSHQGADVELRTSEPHVMGLGVASWVVLILTSLLDNAYRYGDRRKPVLVEIERVGEAAEVSVSSAGPKVDQAERERWFEPFYTGASEPSMPAGAGLGLTLARKLAQEQRGELTAGDCPYWEGTKVTLRLPRAADAKAA
jgi:signal transduction histidine kinase